MNDEADEAARLAGGSVDPIAEAAEQALRLAGGPSAAAAAASRKWAPPRPLDLSAQLDIELSGDADVVPVYGLDVGGTLSKLVFIQLDPSALEARRAVQPDAVAAMERATAALKQSDDEAGGRIGETGRHDEHHDFHCPSLLGTLRFLKFQTCRMENFLLLMKEGRMLEAGLLMAATGGGSLKFRAEFRAVLGINTTGYDELECLMRGIDFLVKEFEPGECYSLSNIRFSRTRDGEAPVIA